MKTKQYKISRARVFGFHVIDVRTELGWETISKPMGLPSAMAALEQLNNRNCYEPAKIVVEDDVPQQGELSRLVSPS